MRELVTSFEFLSGEDAVHGSKHREGIGRLPELAARKIRRAPGPSEAAGPRYRPALSQHQEDGGKVWRSGRGRLHRRGRIPVQGRRCGLQRGFAPRGFKPYWTNLPGQVATQAGLAAATVGPQQRTLTQQAKNTRSSSCWSATTRKRSASRRAANSISPYFIDKAYGIGDFENIWSVEGLGHVYSQRTWILKHNVSEDAHGILIDGQAATMPEKSLTMMHAGLGLCLAESLMKQLTLGQQHAGRGARARKPSSSSATTIRGMAT